MSGEESGTEPKVYFYYETGGVNKGRLFVSLDRDDPADIPGTLTDREYFSLQGLYAESPDSVRRRLFDSLIAQAERIGYERGLTESVSKEVLARRAEFQVIEDEILRHEPGSGSASLDLPGSRPTGLEESIDRAITTIDAMPIVPVVGLPNED